MCLRLRAWYPSEIRGRRDETEFVVRALITVYNGVLAVQEGATILKRR